MHLDADRLASKVPAVTLGFWIIKILATTLGETGGDTLSMTLGLGYAVSSAMFLALVLAPVAAWYAALGSISVASVHEPRAELFYWTTITISQTLGTALGDWMADDGGFGYLGAAAVFGAGLALLVALYALTRTSRVLLFWAAFILTRPLGAAVGDFLDKPLGHGGLDLSRPIASAVLGAVIVLLILILPQRAAPAGVTPASA